MPGKILKPVSFKINNLSGISIMKNTQRNKQKPFSKYRFFPYYWGYAPKYMVIISII